MARFPRIARPCPYLDRLDEAMDGDFCRMCKRTVHDLTDMNDAERAAFVAGCGGEACVSYAVHLSPADAAAALAAAVAIAVAPVALAQQHRPRAAQVRPVPRVPPVRVEEPRYMLAGMIAPPPQPEAPRKAAEARPAPERGPSIRRD